MMRRLFIRHLKGSVAAAVFASVAVASAFAADPEDVVIGAVYNMTGSQAALDGPSARGAVLAVAEANAKGGVLGRRIRLVVRNGESDAAKVASATEELLTAQPRIAALMGLSDSDMVISAAPVAARAGRVFLTSGATSPQLPAEVPDYLMLACFGDNVQAAAAAEWLRNEKRAATVAVLFNRTMSYTDLLHRYFLTRFGEMGGRGVSVLPFAPDDVAAVAAKLERADAVFFAAGPDDVLAGVDALRKSGFAGPIVGGDAFDAAAMWRRRPDISGVYFTTHAYVGPDSTDARVIAFRKLFRTAHPGMEPDAFTALGYDTVRMLIAAVRAAGTDTPARVRTSLAATDRFAGVTGLLSYRPGHLVPDKAVTILEAREGVQRFVAQVMPDRVPEP